MPNNGDGIFSLYIKLNQKLKKKGKTEASMRLKQSNGAHNHSMQTIRIVLLISKEN